MILNKLRNLSRRKNNASITSASIWLMLIFAFVFVFGWWIGSIDPKSSLNAHHTILLTVILPILATIVIALTNFILKETAQKLAEGELKVKDQKIEELQQITRGRIKILRHVKDLIGRELSEDKLANYRQEISSEIETLEEEERAAQELFSWLSEQNNKIALMNFAFMQAMRVNQVSYSTHKMELSKFKEDIFRCLEWLQDSLFKGTPHYVDVTQVANSASILPGGLNNHRNALHSIESNPQVVKIIGDSQNLKLFIDILITGIEENQNDKDILRRVDSIS
jgi:hypothetical protein